MSSSPCNLASMSYNLEILTILIYLVFLVFMGWVFTRFNRNVSDFVRGGAQGSWWLIGASALMSGISAFTFTGNASAVYEAGLTPLIIYVANVSAFLIAGFFVAPWFRQTRAMTTSDILKERFGPEVEQVMSYWGVIMGAITAAIWLWGLATFSAAVFGLPMEAVIIALGLVTILYSSTGGKWAVMATDFVQSLILFPITVLVAGLAVYHAGGISEIFHSFMTPELSEDFRLVKQSGQFEGEKFTWGWICGIFVLQFFTQMNLSQASKYLAVKDGKEARKAAFFAAFMMAVGTFIWFIPPLVARMEFADAVSAVNLKNPSEAAYAVIAMELLPNGLMGLMMVAMFAATMSSMDSGLNTAAGIVVRNIVPPLYRKTTGREPTDQFGLWCGRLVTIGMGGIIILIAVYFSKLENFGLFDSFLIIGSIVGLPTIVPLIYALFVRQMPRWSFFFITLVGMIPSAWSVIDGQLFDTPWTVQQRVFWVFLAGSLAAAFSIICFRRNWGVSEAYRVRIDSFYSRMHTPIDFVKEIGDNKDFSQLRIIGSFCVVSGAFISLLLLLPNGFYGRLGILFVSSFTLFVGFFMRRVAKRLNRTGPPRPGD